MVNGINKPPKVLADHAALGERLAESNRQLAAMQASHRQLLLEMEALRQHAGELQNQTQANRASQTPAAPEVAQSTPDTAKPEPVTESSPPEVATPTPAAIEVPVVPPVTAPEAPTETPAEAPTQAPTPADDNASEEGDPEEAKYLSAQLAKIAALKTQYERVRHLIETTQKIEEKINKGDDEKEPEQLQQMQDELKEQMHKVEANAGGAVPETDVVKQEEKETPLETNKQSTTINDNKMVATPLPSPPTPTQQQPLEKDQSPEDFADEIAAATAAATEAALGNGIENEKEELLVAMMNMFTVFTADLRTQAEQLRSERDRLLAVKAELLRRKGLSSDKTRSEDSEK